MCTSEAESHDEHVTLLNESAHPSAQVRTIFIYISGPSVHTSIDLDFNFGSAPLGTLVEMVSGDRSTRDFHRMDLTLP